jgi:beta-lactamase regulating signal transducer with metallopeptidase domain
MTILLTYLFKLSLSLGVVFLFYQLVLRKLTFYTWNRWYLLVYTLLSFFIPFIDISPVLQRNDWNNNNIVEWVPAIESQNNTVTAANTSSLFSPLNIVMIVVITGMIIMLARLAVQLLSFRRMMKKAKLIRGEGMKLYQVDEEIIPFSFGNSIFINQDLHTSAELQEIILHEFVHVKQKHSLDIIWAELLCLFNWYNPFAWLFKRSIRQNLEFIADNKVLENGINKKQYQYLLLKVIGNNQFSIAQKFNFSSLKKRIAMMNKLKTAKLHLVKFLFILPLLAIILVSFRKQIGDSITQDKNQRNEIAPVADFTDSVPDVMELNDKGYYIDIKGKGADCIVVVKDKNHKEVERILLTKWKENQKYYDNLYGEILPAPPAPPIPPIAPLSPVVEDNPGLKAFLQKNPDVKDIGWVFNNVFENRVIEAHIYKKDGSSEKYDLENEADKAKVEKKYGELPFPPPGPVISIAPLAPLESLEPIKAEPALPSFPPLPPIKVLDKVNRICNDFEITEKKAIMKLKNGSIEKYDLTDSKQRASFENKYGKIISVGANAPELATVAVMTSALGETVIAPITPAVIANGSNLTTIAPVAVTSRDAVLAVDNNGYRITGKEDIVITISRYTTLRQLEDFKKQMKEKGVELKFDKTEFNKGILSHISGTMTYKDSKSVFSATEFRKLVLAMIKDGDRIYFKVNSVDEREEI